MRCALLQKWRRVSTRRAPSSRNGGGYRCDARPPPEMEEGGKTIHFVDARPFPEMEEGIDATRAFLSKWKRVSTRRAPSSRNGIAAPCRRCRHRPPTHRGGAAGGNASVRAYGLASSASARIAMCAVHNGRFHHATASWALEEQLATRRIPTDQRVQLSSRFGKTRPVVRSQSSAVFSVFTGSSRRA